MLNYANLYRLPFSENDNFNGWIEITTECNLRCPGCYRGCDLEEHSGSAKPLELVYHEIDELIRVRNCSMISISGGEPLLHPDLMEIVRFVSSRKKSPVLFTNGILLNEQKLRRLKKAGLTGVVIRKDSLQHVGTVITENEVNRQREKVAQLCSRMGIHVTLTAVLDDSNIGQLADILEFGRIHHRSVGQHLFTLKREICLPGGTVPAEQPPVSLERFVEECETPACGVLFAGYLGSTGHLQSAKWLQAFRFICGKTVLGWADSKWVELFQIVHHWFTGSYGGILKKELMQIPLPVHLLFAMVNRSLRIVLIERLKLIFKSPSLLFQPMTVQPITAVIPPHLVDGKRDLCSSCPDAVLYNGKLVPSCLLEEIIAYNGNMYEHS